MQNDNTLLQLPISDKLKDTFRTAATWAKIIAILGFISVPFSLYESAQKNNIVGALIGAGIVVMLNIFLLNFSRKIVPAIEATDQNHFNEALSDLKMYFKITGIVIIVALCIVILAILFGIMVSAGR
jgi:hypothetical protein